jgi:carbamoyltransferase
LFGGPPREPDGPIETRHMDVARSIQAVTEEILLRMARRARAMTGLRHLCMAGGVALNCVANGRILREAGFERLWVQPAAGDAGGALGAALQAWHECGGERWLEREVGPDGDAHETDAMEGALLGPAFTDEEIEAVLRRHGAVYRRYDRDTLLDVTVERLRQEKVVGWFQGRMEFGPRALGNRSILGDPRSPRMQSVMNLKVKFRESFRPFAPAVRRHRVQEYFELACESPYMLLVAPIREEWRRPVPEGLTGLDLLKAERSILPAVTHVDGSARIQTVDARRFPLFDALLERWERATGCPVLVNTSFNVRGEPIVCTPDDAYRCFVNTEMDTLVMGSFVLERREQPARPVPRRGPLMPD